VGTPGNEAPVTGGINYNPDGGRITSRTPATIRHKTCILCRKMTCIICNKVTNI